MSFFQFTVPETKCSMNFQYLLSGDEGKFSCPGNDVLPKDRTRFHGFTGKCKF